MQKKFLILGLLLSSLALSGCGIQSIPMAKNNVEATLSEMANQYKRRADLIPNLVKTVKGYASHEKETFEAVISARAKATSTTIDASNLTPEKLAAFQSAQGGLSQALGKLMVVAERYPDLKANQNFRDLQAQLEGTENRITISRQRHIEAIQGFNNLVTVFPTSIVAKYVLNEEKLPQWQVSAEEQQTNEQAPNVEF